MIESIIGSVIAAVIVSSLGLLMSPRFRKRVWERVLEYQYFRAIGPHVQDGQKAGIRLIAELVRFLDQDQERNIHSPRYGEFDRNLRHVHKGNAHVKLEALNVKPRMYVTGWPVFVLSKHRGLSEAKRMLRATAIGVARLLDDSWVRIVLPAGIGLSPSKVATTISYRHTIRAAQILAMLERAAPQSMVVLGRMLDSSQDMQSVSGGWRNCKDAPYRDECLWASVYAAGFLYYCVQNAVLLGLADEVKAKAIGAAERTLEWLHGRWLSEGWKHEDLSSEENATELWHEVASVALAYRQQLGQAVLNRFDSYLDALHHPSPLYVEFVKPFGPDRVAIRLAYAYFQAREHRIGAQERCRSLLEYALHLLSGSYDCVEASMLIDMLSEPSLLPALGGYHQEERELAE